MIEEVAIGSHYTIEMMLWGYISESDFDRCDEIITRIDGKRISQLFIPIIEQGCQSALFTKNSDINCFRMYAPPTWSAK